MKRKMSSPLQQRLLLLPRVVAALEKLAPLRLAETAWDNVGVLLEAPVPRPAATKVLLTVDLTPSVLAEAVENPDVGVVVAYHPTIFKGWKKLRTFHGYKSDPEAINQETILRLAAAGISLYSPHTALDNTYNGINDWLVEGLKPLGIRNVKPIVASTTSASSISQFANGLHERIEGAGRIAEFVEPQPLADVIIAIKKHLGLAHVRLSRQAETRISYFSADTSRHSTCAANSSVKKIAVCAGSGGGLFLSNMESFCCEFEDGQDENLDDTKVRNGPGGRGGVDLFWTGELSHHDVLKLRQCANVVLCEHTNTERGYLTAKLAPYLEREGDLSGCVIVSENDKEPLEIV